MPIKPEHLDELLAGDEKPNEPLGEQGLFPQLKKAQLQRANEVIQVFAFPLELRRMIYTTNSIESLHRGLRKIIKTRRSFPNDEAAVKPSISPSEISTSTGSPPSNGVQPTPSSLSCSRIASQRSSADQTMQRPRTQSV